MQHIPHTRPNPRSPSQNSSVKFFWPSILTSLEAFLSRPSVECLDQWAPHRLRLLGALGHDLRSGAAVAALCLAISPIGDEAGWHLGPPEMARPCLGTGYLDPPVPQERTFPVEWLLWGYPQVRINPQWVQVELIGTSIRAEKNYYSKIRHGPRKPTHPGYGLKFPNGKNSLEG